MALRFWYHLLVPLHHAREDGIARCKTSILQEAPSACRRWGGGPGSWWVGAAAQTALPTQLLDPAPRGRCAAHIRYSRRHTGGCRPASVPARGWTAPPRKWRSCETNSMVPSYSRQRLDQHLLGRDVEMVGRLVEHQEVRRVEQHLRHHQPRLLAARQHAAALLDVVAGEAEAAGERAQRRLPGLRKANPRSDWNTVRSPSSRSIACWAK